MTTQPIDILSSGIIYNKKCNKGKTDYILLSNNPIANELDCENRMGLYKKKTNFK